MSRLRRIPFAGWLWILSGLPVGIVLMASPPGVWIAFFTFAVLLEVGHALSPILFAWTHAGYRRLILKYPAKYILVPGAVFLSAFAVGAVTSLGWTSFVKPARALTGQSYAFTDFRNPFGMMVSGYFWWNVYYFGMQNFGVLSMCRRRRTVQRRTFAIGAQQIALPRPAAALCVAATAFGMVALPKLVSPDLGVLFYAVIFVNHWVVAIGLPSRVVASDGPRHRARAWVFVLGVLLLGAIGFVWSAPAWVWRARGYSGLAAAPDYALISRAIPVVLSLRYGLSFVHFLYDRYIWKMGDPEIRAILGSAFAPPTVGLSLAPSPSRSRPSRRGRRRARRVA